MNEVFRLKLERPLVFFDLETTGTDVVKDRIVEISLIKVYPDGREDRQCWRINPTVEIPAASTAVHHITNEDVKDEPTFRDLAETLLNLFEDSDIAGFNSNKFDVPLLMEEFTRCGVKFDLYGRKLIDVQNIYHKMEPRTLIAAYRYYCGEELEGAHSAMADTEATYAVLKEQIQKYKELDNDIDCLAKASGSDKNLDLAARIVRNDKGEPIFNFGKHKGKTVREIVKKDPSFITWMMQSEFAKNTKDVVARLKYEYTHES
ncbi:MAG: 3'-5' exonuclease [Muribaculaceae bacterium]|nr:3'-5' exonuclease [Muribaculaceae bacterium]